MRKLKKFAALLVSAVLTVNIWGTEAVKAESSDGYGYEDEETVLTSGDYEYKILEDGTAEITDYTGEDEELIIPNKLNGVAVTSIDGWVFYGNDTIKTLIIPEGMLSIDWCTFGNCLSLKSVTLPDSLKSIGDWAFSECSNLQKIIIPDTVENIGAEPFSGCVSLTEIVIGQNENYTTVDGVLCTADKKEIIAFAGQRDSYTIPEEVESICTMAFSSGSVKNIVFNSKMKGIDDYAFAYCDSLESVQLPETITYIGDSAFYACASLESVQLPETITYIGDWAFQSCYLLKEIEIPDSVTSIGGNVFAYCSGLESVKLSKNLAEIPWKAFCECSMLTEISVPEGVTSIGDFAFNGCAALASITLPQSLEYIGDAFNYCSSLSKIEIPSSVSNIEQGAFWGCTSLEEFVAIDNENYKTVDGILFSADGKELVAYAGNREKYVLHDGVTEIMRHAFSSGKVSEIELNDDIKVIGSGAFWHCFDVITITVPDSITYIDDYAFSDTPRAVICCNRGSYAHQYATEHGISVSLIGEEGVPGDVDGNGKVTSIDARIILQASASNYVLSDEQARLADTNGDGKVTSIDARVALQVAAGNMVLQ